MKLSEHSKNKLKKTMTHWRVDTEYGEPMFNYLVYGFSPGSFFTAVLANDFMTAMARSHPANTIPALKNLVGWIRDSMPREAWGSDEAVDYWLGLTVEERRAVLEAHKLILTPKEETWASLNDEPTFDPFEVF
jgi:hypothetical protein